MSWYGNYNETTRQLDALIETKPSLATLLLYPDFIQQLKAFNPKLLDYMTNASNIPQEIVTYISVTPGESDSVDRKYKLPLLTVEMVETETTCIMNALLKQSSQNQNYFLSIFDMLKQSQILPLLAGYFSRVNLALCRARYKQALESVYSCPKVLELLIEHSQNSTISNCLLLYLCVESSKNIILPEDKTAIKMGVIRSILNKIQAERNNQNQRSIRIIENLCFVAREIIQRYYLINNGKQMLQIILQEKYVDTTLAMIGQQSQNSFPAMNLALSFLKYYSLSAFNSEQGNEELARKNMQRLENQPFIKLMTSNFSGLLNKVRKQKAINLYGYTLLQVLCHCITLSSNKILLTIKETQLFPTLIDLLFKNQYCNILHKLVQRTFLHVFTTEKNIYEKYKEYLFCEISVIDLTAKRLLDLFPDSDCLEKAKSKAYFGNLIKIIKIYSSISTTNMNIRQAIKAKTQIWNKMANKIIKPYEASCKQQMGQLQNVPEAPPLQFTVRRNQNETMPRLIQNAEALEQIKRQEQTMPKTFQLNDLKKQSQTLSETKIEDDSFFKSPLEDSLNKKKSDFQNVSGPTQDNPAESNQSKDSPKKSISFTQFLNKKKVEVGEEIKMQRSQSGEKRLSADKKTRLTSPSPSRKKNSWKEEQSAQDQTKKDKRITLTKDMPKIPIAHKTASQPNLLAKSTVQQVKKFDEDENKRVLSLSMANLQTLRKTTIYRTNQTPTQKKYRKIREADKPLLAYLGLSC